MFVETLTYFLTLRRIGLYRVMFEPQTPFLSSLYQTMWIESDIALYEFI